jgi:CPA2 family monovalent cation:H+ antiporter-2
MVRPAARTPLGLPADVRTHRETLEQAGLGNAVALVLTSSSIRGAREVMRIARELNPTLIIFARSTYLSERAELRKARADRVFSAEGEVALAMTESLLRHLGATPEQIDREQARVRLEFLGGAADHDPGSRDRLRTSGDAEPR